MARVAEIEAIRRCASDELLPEVARLVLGNAQCQLKVRVQIQIVETSATSLGRVKTIAGACHLVPMIR